MDEMTFSCNTSISRKLREDVSILLRKNNLKAKVKKDHCCQAKDIKKVTGVGMLNGDMIVADSKRKAIILSYSECRKHKKRKEIEKWNGMLCSLRKIVRNIFPEILIM